MEVTEGLRERKKERTRRMIADAAARLFAERGFEAVTVVDVAAAVDVAPKTVFNYFPAKEQLFFDKEPEMGERLVAAVRDRAPGVSACEALRKLLLEGDAPPSRDPAMAAEIATHARVYAESPALQAYAREMFARYEVALAATLAEEFGSDPHDPFPRVMATVLLAPARCMFDARLHRVGAGEEMSGVAARTRREIERAFDAISGGLADFGRR